MALTYVYRPGTSGTPTDFTSAYGGAINMSSTINGATLNVLFQPLAIPTGSDTNYYSIFYLSLESSNTVSTARVYNRAGAIVNSATGVASVASTAAGDTGIMLVTGKVSGVWVQDPIQMTGTVTALGTKNFDISSVVRWEYLSSLSPAIPLGNIAGFVNSVQCTLFYGSLNNLTSGGTRLTSAEFMFALASAKNTTISGTNVLHAPGTDGDTSSIGAFSNATLWTGADASIAVPTGGMVNTDYIGVCIKFIDYANIFPCKSTGQTGTVATMTGSYV